MIEYLLCRRDIKCYYIQVKRVVVAVITGFVVFNVFIFFFPPGYLWRFTNFTSCWSKQCPFCFSGLSSFLRNDLIWYFSVLALRCLHAFDPEVACSRFWKPSDVTHLVAVKRRNAAWMSDLLKNVSKALNLLRWPKNKPFCCALLHFCISFRRNYNYLGQLCVALFWCDGWQRSSVHESNSRQVRNWKWDVWSWHSHAELWQLQRTTRDIPMSVEVVCYMFRVELDTKQLVSIWLH